MDQTPQLKLLFGDAPYFGGPLKGMQSGVKSMMGLVALAEIASRNRKPVRVLEIGSWLGASALTWAYAVDAFAGAGEVVCVDSWMPYPDEDIWAAAGSGDTILS